MRGLLVHKTPYWLMITQLFHQTVLCIYDAEAILIYEKSC